MTDKKLPEVNHVLPETRMKVARRVYRALVENKRLSIEALRMAAYGGLGDDSPAPESIHMAAPESIHMVLRRLDKRLTPFGFTVVKQSPMGNAKAKTYSLVNLR